jgi:hypothetical protein
MTSTSLITLSYRALETLMTNTAKSAKRAGLAAGLLAAAVMGGFGIGDAAADSPPSMPTTKTTTYGGTVNDIKIGNRSQFPN